MDPPLPYMDVAHLFSDGHHLAGPLMTQHRGIEADAVAQIAAGAVMICISVPLQKSQACTFTSAS